ncbi:MAG: ABC transporter ATP-binding protein [Proteobacteria bacterium]|nr:ABC transporter ATP-binding protein [Pseudomonadota bacterium]MBU4297289.1 ABC transporter ATP-binding protein [Pseudomonadota bacterium]MCG2747723.1 ABC transporter ATP-binding protein [Desulfobulbaceae bacterium]
MTLLDIKNVNKHFGGLQAVSQVSFGVQKGMIKSLIGPNGAGKTTLFNLISGNLPLTSGQIFFAGRPIHGLAPYQIARRGISRTFQNIKLFPGMTALENVMIGRHTRSRAGFISGMFHFPTARKEEDTIREKSFELLQLLEISQYADVEAASLAFGQQRAVEFARALASEPSILLLDEPAAGLNIYETAEIARLITKIQSQGITVLLVEHDMSLVMDISDEIVVLSFGQKIAEDIPSAIQQNKEVIHIYLGDADA